MRLPSDLTVCFAGWLASLLVLLAASLLGLACVQEQ
jgi:hypothetical protein